jgi:hypothetical protein
VNLMEVAVSLTVVVGTGAAAAAALNMPELTGRAEKTAARASCHTVENAFAAYTTDNGTPPRKIADIRPYVKGDVSDYRVTKTGVTGPGCAPATP